MKTIGIDVGGTAVKIGYFIDGALIECKRYARIDNLDAFRELLMHSDITLSLIHI